MLTNEAKRAHYTARVAVCLEQCEKLAKDSLALRQQGYTSSADALANRSAIAWDNAQWYRRKLSELERQGVAA